MSQTKWSSRIPFPAEADYKIRCLDVTFAPSSKDTPMFTFEFEVAGPDSRQVGDDEILVSGVKGMKIYLVTEAKDKETGEVDAAKTANCKKRIVEMYDMFGLDSSDINWDNPEIDGFKGKVVYAELADEAKEKRKVPTPEQARKRQQGDIMKNPITGDPLVTHWPKIIQIFGLATDGASSL